MSAPNTKTIGDLCELGNGHGFGPKTWSESGLPIIRIQNLNGSMEFNYFSGSPDPDWVVNPGTLLFSWAGTKGVSFGPFRWSGPQGVLNQHIFKVLPNPGVDPDWLLYALRFVTAKIEKNAHGFKSTLLHVRRSDVTNQSVFAPAISEQCEIARILNTSEKLVSTTKSLWLAVAQRRHWAIHQLLNDRLRLPGCTGDRKVVKIGDLITESRIPVISGSADRRLTVKLFGGGVEKRSLRTEEEGATVYYQRKAGQFIYGKQNLFRGAVGIIPDLFDGFSTSQDVPSFDIDTSKITPQYLLLVFSRPDFYRALEKIATGTGSKRVHPETLYGLTISIPPVPEQSRVVEIVDSLTKEMEILGRLVDAYKEQGVQLLHDLMTGRRRAAIKAA